MTIWSHANWETLSDINKVICFFYVFVLHVIGGDLMIFEDEEKYKDAHGIYAILNKKNGKVYIGQTGLRFEKRFWHHQWKLRHGSHDSAHLQGAWNAYGEDAFVFRVIDCIDGDSTDELDELEKKYIGCCKRLGYSYNILDGGGGLRGYHMSDEQKRKIGEKNRANMTGRKASDETKRKMSQSRKGRVIARSTDVITVDIARQIKQLLVSGMKPSDIAKIVGVEYKHVNNIMSNNSWSNVPVDGWDEYRLNRKTYHRLTEDDHKEIYRLHVEKGYTKQQLAKMYDRTDKMIAKIFRKYEA